MSEFVPPRHSGATEYINELLWNNKALIVPPKLAGKSVGWLFTAQSGEFQGYNAHGKSVRINIMIYPRQGEYEITHVGPINQLFYRGKVGRPDQSFMIIRRVTESDSQDAKPGIAFIVKD